jgi:diguanylate cyclase (GGDEF)-like protein
MQAGEQTSRLRSFLQPVTYLGLGMGLLIVAGLAYLIHKDEQDAYDLAARNGANLVRVFEGYIGRTLKSVDNTLRVLRTSYQRDPEHFDFAAWARDPDVQNELALQLTIVGPDGEIRASTSENPLAGINVADREHFHVHVHAMADTLFISKPLVLRTKNKIAIILSRRITTPDGKFGGVISAAMDPLALQNFYDSLDLGGDGIASLVGFDGVLRARGGSDPALGNLIGKKLAASGVMQRYQHAPTGTYWNVGGTVDGVRRLVSYRVIDGFPLIALIGLAKTDIYKHSAQNARIYYGIGASLILVILVAISFGAAREHKLLTVTSSLARTNAWFQSALANLPLGLCMFGPDRNLIVCNDLYREMYDLTAEQTKVGTSLREIFEARLATRGDPKDADKQAYIEQRLKRAFKVDPGFFVDELSDGRVIAVSRQYVPREGWITVHQDVTAQKHAEAEIIHLAHYDALTGLANRVLFMQRVKAAADRCRTQGLCFAVHLLDLDRFKEVNDTLGHVFGDSLLKLVAQRVHAAMRDGDLVARLGGDEFAVLQHIAPNGEFEMADLAERLLKITSEPYSIDGHEVTVETSIGIALAPYHGHEAEQLLKTADLALYRAKSEGRNTYRLFRAEMELEARSRHALEIDLRMALARNEFELHYQPIIDIATKAVCGVEALVRWRHPHRGLVPPDAFIPLAEETGLIVPLGEWVLGTACLDAAQWPAHIVVAVNLSSVQFRRHDLLAVVTGALKNAGLPPARLELEVTESVLLQNNEENLSLLHALRALGVSISLDDFGTGYSSFSYLQRFPFDRIKIDRSFVANLTTRADGIAVVSAVTGLARALDIATTAEGIETEEQLALLQAAGCGQAQGYLFGRPCPKDELDCMGDVTAPANEKVA